MRVNTFCICLTKALTRPLFEKGVMGLGLIGV
jgi:hypothetical protein